MSIRTRGLSVPLVDPGDLKPKSIQWAYIVRNRIRWATDPATYETVKRKAKADLASLGLTHDVLDQLAASRVIEVDLPFQDEQTGWEFRILPWEFLLSASIGRSIVVVRRLDRQAPAPPRVPKSVTIVASLPGQLTRSGYEFDSEIALVHSNLPFERSLLRNPTLEALRDHMKQEQPDVIHLAGVDLHEGHSILNEPEKRDDRTRDGYYLQAPDGSAALVLSNDLADALTAGSSFRPVLVSCNIFNSAARTAALAVAAGADAAIGFQDEIDNIVAEEFFTNFYKRWRESGWDLLSAFDLALHELASGAQRTGTGIVLWSGRSLIETTATKTAPRRTTHPREKPLELSRDLILSIDPVKSVNYSLLHNGESLFNRFTLTNAHPTKGIDGVRLYVELCAGEQNYPFRSILTLAAGSMQNLTESVRIPLTSTFFRSLRESIRSVLFVRISRGGEDIQEQTYPVRLLAVDEWLDTPELNAFLPSFVLWRDPAVLRVINAAQKHLMTLSDDPAAGFDGYQSVDENAENPSEPVDLQAWTMWSALSYDFPLSYVNPPPSFEESSQRLRSPSDVVDGQRGTCIDLALLYAACLEYVGIYPVIFLLQNHAFPGYWRSEQSRDQFFDMSAQNMANAEKKSASWYSWVIQGYDEIMNLIQGGHLAVIETTWLTQYKGFWEARDAGVENLRDPQEFQSMIDVQRARDESVTPLPVVRGEGS